MMLHINVKHMSERISTGRLQPAKQSPHKIHHYTHTINSTYNYIPFTVEMRLLSTTI